jgi:hypothetical protein
MTDHIKIVKEDVPTTKYTLPSAPPHPAESPEITRVRHGFKLKNYLQPRCQQLLQTKKVVIDIKVPMVLRLSTNVKMKDINLLQG